MGKGWPLLPGRQGAEQRPAAACRSPGLEGGRQPRPGQGEQEAAPVKGIQQHQLDGGDQVGQIAEQGTHEELAASGGLYARMWTDYNKAVQWKITSEKEAE